jgi:hypothetical protein
MRIKGTNSVTTTLPDFFSSITNNVATIAPTSKAQMGVYHIEIVQTASAGTQLTYTYDSLTLTVGCVISSVANFVQPTLADRTYVLYQPTKKIDMATYDNSNMV